MCMYSATYCGHIGDVTSKKHNRSSQSLLFKQPVNGMVHQGCTSHLLVLQQI